MTTNVNVDPTLEEKITYLYNFVKRMEPVVNGLLNNPVLKFKSRVKNGPRP